MYIMRTESSDSPAQPVWTVTQCNRQRQHSYTCIYHTPAGSWQTDRQTDSLHIVLFFGSIDSSLLWLVKIFL